MPRRAGHKRDEPSRTRCRPATPMPDDLARATGLHQCLWWASPSASCDSPTATSCNSTSASCEPGHRAGESTSQFGAFCLGLRGSKWIIKSGTWPATAFGGLRIQPGPISDSVVRSFDQSRTGRRDAHTCPTAKSSAVEPFSVRPINAYGLTVRFADGSSLVSLPTPGRTAGAGRREPPRVGRLGTLHAPRPAQRLARPALVVRAEGVVLPSAPPPVRPAETRRLAAVTISSSLPRKRDRSFGRHRRRPADELPALPQLVVQVAHGLGLADVRLGQRVALVVQHPRPLGHAPRRQGDVGGDRRCRPDPACSAIQSSTSPKAVRSTISAGGSVGTRMMALATTTTRRNGVTSGHPVGLVLDRAGIGIDVEGVHGSIVAPQPAGKGFRSAKPAWCQYG